MLINKILVPSHSLPYEGVQIIYWFLVSVYSHVDVLCDYLPFKRIALHFSLATIAVSIFFDQLIH